MAIISLKCPECRGDLELDDVREFGFCQYCGTKILIKQETQVTQNITNVTNNYINSTDDNNIDVKVKSALSLMNAGRLEDARHLLDGLWNDGKHTENRSHSDLISAWFLYWILECDPYKGSEYYQLYRKISTKMISAETLLSNLNGKTVEENREHLMKIISDKHALSYPDTYEADTEWARATNILCAVIDKPYEQHPEVWLEVPHSIYNINQDNYDFMPRMAMKRWISVNEESYCKASNIDENSIPYCFRKRYTLFHPPKEVSEWEDYCEVFRDKRKSYVKNHPEEFTKGILKKADTAKIKSFEESTEMIVESWIQFITSFRTNNQRILDEFKTLFE